MSVEAAGQPQILEARGTLARDPQITRPATGRRLRLLVELGLLFVAAPLLMRHAIFSLKIPLPLVLQPVLIGFILYLLWDRTFRVRSELGTGFGLRVLGSILLIFAVVGSVIAAFVYTQMPEHFLRLPSRAPHIWLMIMIFYPLLSVIPQELIYRTFFFHRYGPLFGNARWLAIGVNGVLFGFAHIIFGSYVSIVLTAILGCLLAWRYDQTRSFWAVWLEHALYGCLIFTVGLGHYFFTGVASIR